MTDHPTAAGESSNTDPVRLWQNQTTTAYRLSPTALATAEYEHARLRAGVTIKSAIMLLSLVLALYKAATETQTLLRLGALAMAVGFGRVLYTLQRTRRGDAETVTADRAGEGIAAPLLVHYRASLEGERDRLSGPRLWVPFAIGIPAGFVVMLTLARAHPALEPYLAIELIVFATAMPLAFLYGRWNGRRYQAQLDLLDAFTRG